MRFRKTVPASPGGAVITDNEYCSPFDHAFKLIVRVQEGRIILIVISICDERPRILFSALVTMSFADCPGALLEAAKQSIPKRIVCLEGIISFAFIWQIRFRRNIQALQRMELIFQSHSFEKLVEKL